MELFTAFASPAPNLASSFSVRLLPHYRSETVLAKVPGPLRVVIVNARSHHRPTVLGRLRVLSFRHFIRGSAVKPFISAAFLRELLCTRHVCDCIVRKRLDRTYMGNIWHILAQHVWNSLLGTQGTSLRDGPASASSSQRDSQTSSERRLGTCEKSEFSDPTPHALRPGLGVGPALNTGSRSRACGLPTRGPTETPTPERGGVGACVSEAVDTRNATAFTVVTAVGAFVSEVQVHVNKQKRPGK